MLGLLDDKGNEKLKASEDFLVNVLGVSVKQINENTKLHVIYKSEKIGRYVKNIIFKVKSQADTIPFDLRPPRRHSPASHRTNTRTPFASSTNCASPMPSTGRPSWPVPPTSPKSTVTVTT